ncbi:MAG: formate dehydrogenase accessory sulfurtransferase FdhD [Acidihalobacter sp.]
MDKPTLSNAGLAATRATQVMDERGEMREVHLTGERPLTLFVDKREVVTLMTLGGHPEWLTLGYLRNQGFVRDLADVESVHVDWEVEAVAVKTRDGVDDWDAKLLDALSGENTVYKQAGAVHACALCADDNVLCFVEDVGRHNAVDAIAGHMWLEAISGHDKLFYTTGRLTSEMVIKVAQMGIPVLLSRSGVTQMGLDIARRTGVVLIARAKGRHFLVYHGAEHIELDAVPPARPGARLEAAR